MLILGIDPGPTQSGYVLWSPEQGLLAEVQPLIAAYTQTATGDLCAAIREHAKANVGPLAIEVPTVYGSSGTFQAVLDTAEVVGRCLQEWERSGGGIAHRIKRAEVLRTLGIAHRKGTSKDTLVRAALLDLIGPQGSKKAPGPTHGVKSHAWQALAVAYTAAQR